MDRPGWDHLMEYVRLGDTLAVTELSLMTRSLRNLLETAKLLEQRQVHFASLRENIDTSTATGRCLLSMMVRFIKWNGRYGQTGRRQAVVRPRRAGKQEADREPM